MSDAIDGASTVLEVRRTAIGDTRLTADPHHELGDGQVRLRIDSFAVTANNVTYALFGDALAYWQFFPTSDGGSGWGRVPAMGWADVVESRVDGIDAGMRVHGWFPMAEHAVVDAAPTGAGFRDDGPHRAAHAPVYRSFVATDRDPLYDDAPDGEDRHALLRGLFLTGFLAEEFFADAGGSDAGPYFGADRVIVLSASSKTAIGFAQRAAARGAVRVVGVTSPRNASFVEGLGFYDDVIPYDDVERLAADTPSVSIDMAGAPAVLGALHGRLGDGLLHSMIVGRSHHDAPDPTERAPLPGPTPALFFAPTEVTRRQDEWGSAAYAQRTAAALSEFVAGSRDWLTVDHRRGADGVRSAWADVYAGSVPPDTGVVASFA